MYLYCGYILIDIGGQLALKVFTLLHGAVSMSFQETNTKGFEEGNDLQKQISELQKLAQLQF